MCDCLPGQAFGMVTYLDAWPSEGQGNRNSAQMACEKRASIFIANQGNTMALKWHRNPIFVIVSKREIDKEASLCTSWVVDNGPIRPASTQLQLLTLLRPAGLQRTDSEGTSEGHMHLDPITAWVYRHKEGVLAAVMGGTWELEHSQMLYRGLCGEPLLPPAVHLIFSYLCRVSWMPITDSVFRLDIGPSIH